MFYNQIFLHIAVDNFIGSFLTINLWLFSRGICVTDFYLQIQNLENIPETNINVRKLKEQIKKQLNNSIIDSERHENKELQGKAENVQKNNEAAGKI